MISAVSAEKKSARAAKQPKLTAYFRKSLKACRAAVRPLLQGHRGLKSLRQLGKRLDGAKGRLNRIETSGLQATSALDPLERQRHAKQFFMLSGMALLKGDIECAERMLWQANVCDPTSAYPEERLRELADQAKRSARAAPAAGNGRRKFDFLYTPTLRGLSTEFSSLVPLHPQVFSVSKTELDQALESEGEWALLEKYQRAVLDDRPHIKGGLIQHAYIANQYAGPEIAARLAAITTRAVFIHGVREPLEMAASTFNHELIARECGAYRFYPVVQETPFLRDTFELDTWKKQGAGRAKVQATQFSLDQSIIDKHFIDAISRPRHYAVGNCYAQHFEAWQPIDLSRPSPPIRHTVQRLFEAAGVGTEIDHLAFYASEGTKIHRLMVQNFLYVNCFGYTLLLGIGFADRMIFSNTFKLCELFAFRADDRFNGTELERQSLCITVSLEQWRLLPKDVRIRLIQSHQLLEFCDFVLIPSWLKSYKAWTSGVKQYLLRSSDPALTAQVRDHVGQDLEHFIARHPQFERLWPNAVAALGG